MTNKSKKKYYKGGKLNGKSHSEGGISIEVEGGEYVIKKDSVNAETEPVLESINKTGKLNYKYGGKIPIYNAKIRRKNAKSRR